MSHHAWLMQFSRNNSFTNFSDRPPNSGGLFLFDK